MTKEYRVNGRTVSEKELKQKEKLIGFCNALNGTDYNLDSINVKTVISHHGFQRHVGRDHFAYTVSNTNNDIVTR